MKRAALVLACACLGPVATAYAQDGPSSPDAGAPAVTDPQAEPDAGAAQPGSPQQAGAAGGGGEITLQPLPPMYRELPVPLAAQSSGPAPAPSSDIPVAPARRRARLGPWELEGRIALSSRGSVGPGVALGYRFARGFVALADVSFGFDVADEGKAGPSGVDSAWGWAAGLELKAYLQPARLRRVVPVFRFRVAFGYSDVNVESEESVATYRVSGTPYAGAAIFLTARAGLLVELGAEIARVVSSLRYDWEGAVVSRLALVLRW